MKNIRMLLLLLSLVHGNAYAQDDSQNLGKAREALDVSHNCAEASKYLNLVSPASRQSALYLLNMGKNQDCMNNTAQAIYYYNKYLAVQPGNDSVTRRVAELTDKNNKVEKNKDNNVDIKTYKPAAKKHKKKRRSLVDDYYYWGLGYSMGLGADAPLRSGLTMEAGNGFTIMREKAVLDINVTASLMGSPNDEWEARANQSLPLGAGALSAETGWAESFTIGFSPLLLNHRDIAVAAGVFGGFNVYSLLGNFSADLDVRTSLTPAYGIKANLYLGEHVMFFGRVLLTSANTLKVSSYYSGGAYTIPVSYTMANLGISVRLDSWW